MLEGRNIVALPWCSWHTFSKPSITGALDSFPVSTITGTLMPFCCWAWGPHHPEWSRLERCRSSNVGALPGSPWQDFSRFPGTVGSFILSPLTLSLNPGLRLTLTLMAARHCGRGPHCIGVQIKKCGAGNVAHCPDDLALPFPVSLELQALQQSEP